MEETNKRPFLALLTSNPLSLVGTGFVVTAVFTWLFILPLHTRGHVSIPYIGIIGFVIVPILLAIGLILIPIGIYQARKKIMQGLLRIADRKVYVRRFAIAFAIMTAFNLIIGTQITYRAVEHMETVQFCGQSCHVMKPEFTAHQNGPHARVECVDCHVAPGASGWFQSKIAGTRQLVGVTLNNYERPIESAMESNRLVPATETCEQCHWPAKFDSVKLRVLPKYQDDESNTRSITILMMLTGGGAHGGIHGAHFGPGVEIRYAAADAKRQTIPWIEYQDRTTGVSKTFLADGSTAASVANLPRYGMQCVDCHNRPTHTFDLPERAVDRAMVLGAVPVTLPYVKKKSVELLKASYASNEEASQKIPVAFAAFYQQSYPDVYSRNTAAISDAGKQVAAIYNRNVFPDLKVTWGTYPNNLGHTDFPGCFRCHDGAHSTAGQKETITQDCNTCHEPLAVEEADPQLLKALGLDVLIADLQKNGTIKE
jgi:nitrate/TMAO reductase-like tetraheme cytochrome c subunit